MSEGSHGGQVITACGEPRPRDKGADWLLCRFYPNHLGRHSWEPDPAESAGPHPKLVIRARQGGKTTEMIRLAAEHRAYIVCTDHRRAGQIAQQAKGLGLSIPFPMTAIEWRERDYHPPGVRGLLFDDLDRIIRDLSGVPVLAATWTEDADRAAGGPNAT
jgi:hypothetical protein